ncbi:ABC-type molybdenum transport system ATPase subunit/photorepair protein PhrA [Flavobacterium sp. W4I14]|nr:ABC-type molybdenum transport system ATPase subunit/photorepair protein PhrA [Flavobacterium sp. W4I14]
MAIKIKQLEITGLRGIRDTLSLALGEKSVLLYGDNGTGKSSISDSVEWYYTDAVSHLSGEEIDLKEALRNAYFASEEESNISVNYNKAVINSQKKLLTKKGKLVSEYSNVTTDFSNYLESSKKENLILRYQFLRDFIDRTKGDKLKNLSDIIGFSEVTKIKDVLRKSFNSLKSEIKSQNFENQINTQKQTLIEKIGAAVSQENNFYEKINEIIADYGTGITVGLMEDVDKVLLKLKTPVTTKIVAELRFLETYQSSLTTLKTEIDLIDKEYDKYFKEFEKIAADVQSIMQTYFAEMLKSGCNLISKKFHTESSCPLCLQPKDLNDLQSEIKVRLLEIEESSKKKAVFDNAKISATAIVDERIKRLATLGSEVLISDTSNSTAKNALDELKKKMEAYKKAISEKVTSGNKIAIPNSLKLVDRDFSELKAVLGRIEKIKKALATDNTTLLFANISAAKDAFQKIKKFEAEREKLEAQKKSLGIIFDGFVKKQKDGLQDFIDNFSDTINEFYQYMNPGELFEEIRIVTMGEENELNGITIEFKYKGNWVSPPQKYFSESHLNCFGISFFLASVIAFNKENKFLLLDDIISSFDTNHRKRFADLLFEKFADYQIILLTHEEQWFQYVKQISKRKGWIIGKIKWTETKGTHLDENPSDLKELVEADLTNGNVTLLGNPIRKYLEYILKTICFNLEVKLNFRYNEVNEKRMPDEMINELKAKINKASAELKLKLPIIERLTSSNVFGNLLSHDNPFDPKIGDLKAFWNDIIEFESVFKCQQSTCTKPQVSLKNYDTVAKKIRCGCDATKYDWK